MRLRAPLYGDEGDSCNHDEAGKDGSRNPVVVDAMVAIILVAAATMEISPDLCVFQLGIDMKNSRCEIKVALMPTPATPFTVTFSVRSKRLRHDYVRQPNRIANIHRCEDQQTKAISITKTFPVPEQLKTTMFDATRPFFAIPCRSSLNTCV